MNDNDLLRPHQVAARRGCSVATLANQRCKGVGLPYLRIGGRIYYRASDVLAQEERSLVEVGAAA